MKLTDRFSNGDFVVTAEVGPPKGFHVEEIVEEATEHLSTLDAVNVSPSITVLSAFILSILPADNDIIISSSASAFSGI